MHGEFRRCAIVCFAAMMAALSAFAEDTPSAPTPEKPVLRLVTYNIHHAEGLDGKLDLGRIVAVILALKPDVVCLQEVDRNLPRTDRLDFPALLSEKLGMPGYFSANYRFDGGEYGNATFSQMPLLSWANEPLPGGEGLEPRGRLETVFDWNGAPITIWNTHLGLKRDEREQQSRHILKDGFAPQVIFCGDMNENTRGAGMALVVEALGEDPEARICDDPTFPAGTPEKRIDHIFAGAAFNVLRCEVVRNEQTAVASDHLPVFAEIALR